MIKINPADDDAIRAYLHSMYDGYDFKHEAIENIINDLVAKKIINNSNKTYLNNILSKYIRHSKKKGIYYFNTKRKIILKY